MANIRSNTEDYINKLYDHTQDTQKQLLVDTYNVNNSNLDTQAQNTQQQAQEYTNRANVEVQKVAQAYKPANVSDSYKPQASLAVENQQRNNAASINNQQQVANAEYERLRKLYADQYSAAIKQAQADNDMARAQQLYEAAKKTEQQLQAFTTQMGTLDNEALINQIYNSANESQRQQIAAQQAQTMSELEAQQAEKQRQTDAALTQTYVEALKRGKNYNEVQNAYGLGSGNMAQAQLARELGTAADLTELRRAQMANDAQIGANRVDAQNSYAQTLANALKANEQARAEAMFKEALTQQPKVTYSSSGGKRDGGVKTETEEERKKRYEKNYASILDDIANAKVNGYYGGAVQSMINAAYAEDMISKEQKKQLEKHRNGLIYAG